MIRSSFQDVFKRRKTQKTVMVLCFIYAVVMGVLFSYQLYAFYQRMHAPTENGPSNQTQNRDNPPAQPRNDIFRGVSNDSPAILAFSLGGMIISTLAGLALYENTFVVEHKEIRVNSIKGVLLPDEQRIISLLEGNNVELTQSELVMKSELSKLKVSRTLQRLESRGIITKYRYGVTNKIMLKQ
jgi:uncharacterized membrane protein